MIADYEQKLEQIASLKQGWDSYDADLINQLAINRTRIALKMLSEISFNPYKVSPSVEGAIAVMFLSSDNLKSGDIEFFNDGDILAITRDYQKTWHDNDYCDVFEVDPNNILNALLRLKEFILS